MGGGGSTKRVGLFTKEFANKTLFSFERGEPPLLPCKRSTKEV